MSGTRGPADLARKGTRKFDAVGTRDVIGHVNDERNAAPLGGIRGESWNSPDSADSELTDYAAS